MSQYQQTRLEMPRIPPGIRLLLLVNVGVFLVMAPLAESVRMFFGLSWHGLGEYFGLGVLRLLTYQFVHGLGVGHILFNMLSLIVFGGMVEDLVGRTRMLRLYLCAGVAGGLLELLLRLVLGQDPTIIGASGSCFGLMVYAACRMPNVEIILILVRIQLWIVAALFSVIALYNILVELAGKGGTGAADGGHLGGAIWGLLVWKFPGLDGWFANLVQYARSWRTHRARQAAAERAASLDEVLAKVKREGLSSLSARERKVLERTSEEMRRH